MRVVTAQIVDMHGDGGVVDQPLKELVGQIDVEFANHRTGERHMPFQTGAA